ncbi:ankyrin [Agrocybe pediades]|nr:ankyrin [Agrocybe pediades]
MTSVREVVANSFGLHEYSLRGDDEGVRRALQNGADVNALDSRRRNAILCAIAGQDYATRFEQKFPISTKDDANTASYKSPARLNALKLLLRHPSTSLVSLHLAPESTLCVGPLGLSAFLNYPDAVRALLEETNGSVMVDGPADVCGGTALMYAARDGWMEVVQILLSHGARADARDQYHHTPIQFAIEQKERHPRILWLCETTLRWHRLLQSESEESKLCPSEGKKDLLKYLRTSAPLASDLEAPPASVFSHSAILKFNATLLKCIRSCDLPFLYSVLFSPPPAVLSPSHLYPLSVPPLVNYPDDNGWALIHHCATVDQPSIDMLDALYCAGADVALCTLQENYTILHVLARFAKPDTEMSNQAKHSLKNFALHLIRDLQAPLGSWDKANETCIHQAAEHGHSLELLKVLLQCDVDKTVRERKNSRGLTALQVAKPEFLCAFGFEAVRPVSVLSQYTIKPSTLTKSFSEAAAATVEAEFDIHSASKDLIANLKSFPSTTATYSTDLSDIRELEASTDELENLMNSVVIFYRSRIDDTEAQIDACYSKIDIAKFSNKDLSSAAKSKLSLRGLSAIPSKRRQRGSEDSQETCVSVDCDSQSSASSRPPSSTFRTLFTTQATSSDSSVTNSPPTDDTAWVERFARSDPVSSATIGEFLGPHARKSWPDSLKKSRSRSTTSLRLKQVLKKDNKLEDEINAAQQEHARFGSITSTKVKSWLKRMKISQKALADPFKLSVVVDVDEQKSAGVDEVQLPSPRTSPTVATTPVVNRPLIKKRQDIVQTSIDNALRSAQIVLDNVNHHLQGYKIPFLLRKSMFDAPSNLSRRCKNV